MKTIHIVPNSGLSAQTASDLLHEYGRRGHSVTAVTHRGPLADSFRARGIPTVTAPLGGAFDVSSPIRLSKLLREAPEGRTVVHTYRFADVRTAARARSLAGRPDVKIALTRLLARPAETGASAAAIYTELDAIHFPADCMRELFLSSSPRIDADKLHTVGIAAVLPRLPETAATVRDSSSLRLLAAGPIGKESGLDTLVEALSLIADLNPRLTVIGVGAGPVVMPVIRLSRRLGVADRIDWRGEYADLHSAIRAADVAVCADRSTDVIAAEPYAYMAHGIPTAATDTPLYSEMATTHDNIRLAAASDATALAEAIRSAAQSDRRHSPAEFGPFADAMEKLYLELMH